MEFQAIVLAAGQGTRMTELTSDVPKCLLPIGNKPMIWYPVRMFEKAGFSEINIITLESIKSRVETELKVNHGIKSSLNIVGLDDSKSEDEEDELGTAYSLKLLKDKINKDCIIVSCDLITNFNLQKMANFYRVNNASLVLLLSDTIEQTHELPVPGSKNKYAPERDLIGLDTHSNRILYYSTQEDIEEIEIKTSVLKKYPKFIWTNKLQDAHLFIIKKWLIDYIVDNQKIFSLKSDFLPFICKKQFSSKHRQHNKDQNNSNNYPVKKTTIYDYIKEDELSSLLNSKKTDPISCYAFIQADGFCLRTNNLAIYAEANRQIMGKIMPHFQKERTESLSRYDKSQIGSDSLIGEATVIGEKSLIKRSVIGKNCKIGEKVKITNSILMDNVTIAEGVVITGSIICSNSKINQKSEFKDCVVSYNQDIITTGKYSNETIQDVDSFIDDAEDDDD